MATPLSELEAFLLDMDGTTYLGHRLLPGARRFLALLERRGAPFLFFTNNSSADRNHYAAKLANMGLPVPPERVITSGEATALYLTSSTPYRRVYVVGTPSLERELAEAGLELVEEGAEAVVLGFDTTLTYAKLERAAHLLRAGAAFFATNPDKVCPTERGPIPDCGSIIALLRTATGAEPTVIGKPEALMVEMALEKLGGIGAERVGLVGDRLYTDIRMANRCGLTAILVLSGETRRADLDASPDRPDYVLKDLGQLAGALAGAWAT